MTSDAPTPARKVRRRAFSKLTRRLHLLFALFLTPWALMYALSTMAMQHREHLTGHHKRVEPDYAMVATEPLEPTLLPAEATKEQAAEIILQTLNLEGAHRVSGDLASGKLVITRDRPIHSLRITYLAGDGVVQIERQDFNLVYALEMLHRRRGFNAPYWANDLWGVMVDAVIVAILLWALTGLWMWWETKPTRLPGAACLFFGAALFAFFLAVL